MSLPELFDRTRRPLGLEGPPPSAGEAGDGVLPGSGPMLSFDIEFQDEDFWCWAAVGVSVRRLLRGDFMSQCELATAVFNGAHDCCQEHAPCNKVMPLERALSHAGVFAGGPVPPVTPASIRQQLDAGRPLGCAVRWFVDNRAHFVVVYGFSVDDGGTPWVAVDDPKYGKWAGPYDSFRTAYQDGAGRWIASYFTA